MLVTKMFKTDFKSPRDICGLDQHKYKHCKTERERACLRAVKLISRNVVDIPLKLIKKYKIDINVDLNEFPSFSCVWWRAETFIGIAITFSSFDTIKKLLKAGANPYKIYNSNNALNLSFKGFIPQIFRLCKAKKDKTTLYLMGLDYYNGVRGFYNRKQEHGPNRFALINKLLLMEPVSCNAYTFTKKDKIEMLHKNLGPSKVLLEPNKKLFRELLLSNKLFYDDLFRNLFGKFVNEQKNICDTIK